MATTFKLNQIVSKIRSARKRYGTLKKCEFHLHTPDSYDYMLTAGREYKEISTKEILDFAEQSGLISSASKAVLIEKTDFQRPDIEIPAESESPYSCLKEQIAFELVARKLFIEEIEVVLIADHHTTSGFNKLKFARDAYNKRNGSNASVPYTILLGVEISCSEKNHVVGIFDCSHEIRVNHFLDEIVMSKVEGTYLTSMQVIDKISEIGGIGYLAHVNTSEMGSSWSGAYNKKLYNAPQLKILGFTNLEKISTMTNYIREQGCKKSFCIFHESDAHTVEDIGQRNTWIKFSHVNFAALQRAITDYKICIYEKYPSKSDKYIAGVFIDAGSDGFLINSPSRVQENNPISECFVAGFSRDLNCIIGGRGTGKSTLLTVLESVLNPTFSESSPKDFLHSCKHSMIYIMFSSAGQDYLLRFVPQLDDNGELLHRAYSTDVEGKKTLSPFWITVFKLEDENDPVELNYEEAVVLLQNNFYRRGYSINKLVSEVDNDKIGSFVKDVIFLEVNPSMNNYIQRINNLRSDPHGKFVQYLKNSLNSIMDELEKQRQFVGQFIDEFNRQQDGVIQVVYSPREKKLTYYLDPILKSILCGKHPVENTLFSWDAMGLFFKDATYKIGYLKFLNKLLNRRFKEIERDINLINYQNIDPTYRSVDSEYITINEDNIALLYNALIRKITAEKNRIEFLGSLLKYFEVVDDFSIKFNINRKESVTNQPICMKSIDELSLGQKVVALLTFVFEYGKYINDNTPLIIDQPEDNLDNQYIYQNLVDSLRSIKNQRQVLVVTHSSTIVTNAEAEQIIIMDSDNQKGWIQANGYPNQKSIVKHVINHLEGGILSFKNKYDKYQHYIEELNGNSLG